MIPGSANSLLLASAADDGYAIERSLRFNSADSAYLSRTPASAGNRKTWTWAGWVKRSTLGTGEQNLFGVYTAENNNGNLQLTFTADAITVNQWSGGYILYTSAVYRDTSAWYHIVLSVDTTQATAANRIKLYVNGSQVTAFSSTTYPAQNTDLAVNQATQHEIGVWGYTSLINYFPGYLADIHFIDGQALDPTSFGEFDDNGIWQPIDASGLTYGTNGFQLKFADNSSNTATTLGKDTSPNGNNWTPNNLSVTAGAGNDSLVDVPTNGAQTDTGAGGEVRGNYCTLNPNMTRDSFITYSNGNLDFTQAASTGQAQQMATQGTIGVSSGKWYWEVTKLSTNNIVPGVAVSMDAAATIFPSDGYIFYNPDGSFAHSGFTLPSNGASNTANDIIGIALDADNRSVQFFKNGASQGTATNGPAGKTWFPSTVVEGSSSTGAASFNFGQRSFAYTAPSGFKALNTANLPAPVVTKPSDVMDVKLYTGNGSTQTISGLGFSPDFVWIKQRSAIIETGHILQDTVRGVNKSLFSNTTDAESSFSYLTSFNSDGFGVDGTTFFPTNGSGGSYVAWTWDAGSSTVTNTQGSISSQVRANASAGFSVVTYTGTGANATVGHDLGVAPGMIIVKRRNSTSNWQVRHTSIAAANSIQLNLTNAAASATTVWNSTAPSSTVFSIGTDATVNASGGTYVAYCFAPVAGYSSFGSYVGNGSSDGVFVYTGFRPRWVLIKNTGGTNSWVLCDGARNEYNVVDKIILPSSSGAETTFNSLDILSNGFKIRSTDTALNANASLYIYAAFAEHPFQYARAR